MSGDRTQKKNNFAGTKNNGGMRTVADDGKNCGTDRFAGKRKLAASGKSLQESRGGGRRVFKFRRGNQGSLIGNHPVSRTKVAPIGRANGGAQSVKPGPGITDKATKFSREKMRRYAKTIEKKFRKTVNPIGRTNGSPQSVKPDLKATDKATEFSRGRMTEYANRTRDGFCKTVNPIGRTDGGLQSVGRKQGTTGRTMKANRDRVTEYQGSGKKISLHNFLRGTVASRSKSVFGNSGNPSQRATGKYSFKPKRGEDNNRGNLGLHNNTKKPNSFEEEIKNVPQEVDNKKHSKFRFQRKEKARCVGVAARSGDAYLKAYLKAYLGDCPEKKLEISAADEELDQILSLNYKIPVDKTASGLEENDKIEEKILLPFRAFRSLNEDDRSAGPIHGPQRSISADLTLGRKYSAQKF